jgi:hypothetical protein
MANDCGPGNIGFRYNSLHRQQKDRLWREENIEEGEDTQEIKALNLPNKTCLSLKSTISHKISSRYNYFTIEIGTQHISSYDTLWI